MEEKKLFLDMCRKAKEIQDLWTPKSGDLYLFKSAYNPLKLFILSGDIHDVVIKRKLMNQHLRFWIPRQEDLQNIVKELDPEPNELIEDINLMDHFYAWFRNSDRRIRKLDEAWINFTMGWCFNKKWDFEAKQWTAIGDD